MPRARKFNYQPIQSRATSLIKRFGREYTFTRETDTAYDPASGDSTSATATYTSSLVWLNFNRSEIDGDSVRAGDAAPIMESANAPMQGDTLIHQGVKWRIERVETVEPGDTVVIYKLQVRRGS